MEEIVKRLMESRRLDESDVGAFYVIGDHILANTVPVSQGDEYGDFINYSSHWDLWRALCKSYPRLKGIYEYDDFPRGRVVFSKADRKFIIYCDPKLNKDQFIDMICKEFHLGSNYVVNDRDEHYDSLRYGTNRVLGENMILKGPISQYVNPEVVYKRK